MDQDYPIGSPDQHDPSPSRRRIIPFLSPRNRRLFFQSVLFLLTVFFTIKAGFLWNLQFLDLSEEETLYSLIEFPKQPSDLLNGLPFAMTLLIILLAHEMGHYFACRRYRIEATLPYVIPAPPWQIVMGQLMPLVLFGTFGAVIRIRSLFRDRIQLFDVGIAGPLAGIVFAVPALALGVHYSTQLDATPVQGSLEFGEPLLFQLAVQLLYRGAEGSTINLHPIGWAAWFGMLATSLNLLPVGQLDGGHIVYALFGKRVHKIVSYATLSALICLGIVLWPGYLLFGLILIFLRLRHPSPFVDLPVIGPGRAMIALTGLVIFVLTFVPVPVRLIEHVG